MGDSVAIHSTGGRVEPSSTQASDDSPKSPLDVASDRPDELDARVSVGDDEAGASSVTNAKPAKLPTYSSTFRNHLSQEEDSRTFMLGNRRQTLEVKEYPCLERHMNTILCVWAVVVLAMVLLVFYRPSTTIVERMLTYLRA